jgi:hypothetical protein
VLGEAIAVSGPTVNDSDRPSMSVLRRPARWTTSRTARPTHQCAVLVE